ncbi:hypothetical protein LF1_06110 [Rubripirellula obstinata]|uniref:Uncharacterized protein n=1 Tax=Rubripirellula obstinata TaxID=406547 RepID=A0A5B1CC10_9BACT|nr:hypothetical protein LF1_06110 [Rubripirellula obstinata]
MGRSRLVGSWEVLGLLNRMKGEAVALSPDDRRRAVAEVLSRGVVRWRKCCLMNRADGGEDAPIDGPVSEISRDSLAERLDPRAAGPLSVDERRCV